MSASKKCKIYHVDDLGQPLDKLDISIDWRLCALCQIHTNERLQCPGESKRTDFGAGYISLESNLRGFQEYEDWPISVDVKHLDDGSGIANTLANNQAKWHASCRLKCSSSRLARLQKAKTQNSPKHKDAKHTRSKYSTETTSVSKCFFCEEPETKNSPLHESSTKTITERVHKCAIKLNDQRLIAKLSAGDMVAQDAKYHAKCLVKLYNASSRTTEKKRDSDEMAHGIALAGLIDFMEEARLADEAVLPVFKLSNLAKLYSDKLKDFGVPVTDRIHSTKLKERLLANVLGLSEYKGGREVMLTFSDDIASLLRRSVLEDGDDVGMCFAKCAKIIRKEMLGMTNKFNGSFPDGCQENSVPKSLLALLSMIMDGTTVESYKDSPEENRPVLSIAQLIQYNTCKKRRKSSPNVSDAIYHSKERETPLPIYVGLLIHGQTRKRDLVDTFFQLGLSISYDRLLEISTNMANSAIQQYEQDGAVCPLILRNGLFTTAAVDNIDHNPSSTSAKGAFHGTGISLFQNPVSGNSGIDRGKANINPELSSKSIQPLPEFYTHVAPVALPTTSSSVPAVDVKSLQGDGALFHEALKEEDKWLCNVRHLINTDTQSTDKPVSWAAFHASQQLLVDGEASITSLLPLFPEEAKSFAMIRHSMDTVKQSIQLLNPGQIPIIAFDQPLYAIAKQVQWYWSDWYGEDKFVIMFGGLHVEMAAWATVGDWLESSGWTTAITQANVASPGTAESFLKASHVTRTRYAHQVTASALSIILHKAYDQAVSESNDHMEFEEWCKKRAEAYPQFQYWYLTIKLELLVLVFVRSLREANFPLYVDSLSKLIPWFFALDHINYARWLPVHVRDMISLGRKMPEVANEFGEGNFVVNKTNLPFSAIAIDQAHEQNNALIKGDGGAVGLTQNPQALLRWMTAGPEVARALDEFKNNCLSKKKKSHLFHHENTKSAQDTFAKNVQELAKVLQDMGNPFLEESGDLLALDTKDIADSGVVETVCSIEKIGQQSYDTYINERLINRSKPISDTIKKHSLPLFSKQGVKVQSSTKQLVSSLKSDCSLFSRLYISCQTRSGDLGTFFKHENHAYPPSLSQNGKLRIGTKSDLVECLEKHCVTRVDVPVVDVVILDGAAIINMLKPVGVKTFQDYATHTFLPFIRTQLRIAARVDIVWEINVESSLKSTTRDKRGKGNRRRVAASNSLPGNWQAFLRLDENKTELFHFLAHVIKDEVTPHKVIFSTCGQDVVCSNVDADVSSLAPCSHEEADTRMILHAVYASRQGYKRIMIRTVDTDVLVLTIAYSCVIEDTDLWVAFSSGKHLRYIPAHDICQSLGNEKSQALPIFHSFTGCDTVSSFSGRGKKTAFGVWMAYNDVTKVFQQLFISPSTFSEDLMPELERFVILLYDRTSTEREVNAARKQLFCSKSRSIEAIPPTSSALIQHTKRALYQGGYIWGQAHIQEPELPSPDSWGWKYSEAKGAWEPVWTVLPQAADSCEELLRCGCKKGCKGHCKCRKAALRCTALCLCSGLCDYNDEIP